MKAQSISGRPTGCWDNISVKVRKMSSGRGADFRSRKAANRIRFEVATELGLGSAPSWSGNE